MGLFNLFKKKTGYKFNIDEKNPMKIEELEAFEKENNIKLPKILREYYLTYGDAEIKPCNFNSHTDLRAICLPNDSILEMGREDGWLPATFYPIAYDSGGNYYWWNSDDNNIYLMFNDNVDNPFVICNSVEELFKHMEKSVK